MVWALHRSEVNTYTTSKETIGYWSEALWHFTVTLDQSHQASLASKQENFEENKGNPRARAFTRQNECTFFLDLKLKK